MLLAREGLAVAHARVERRSHDEGPTVRRRSRTRVAAADRTPVLLPTAPHEPWSLDVVRDALARGRRLRLPAVVDAVTRAAPAIEVAPPLPGGRVGRVPEPLATDRGVPDAVVRDTGPEPTARAPDQRASGRGVRLRCIRPGKAVRNASAGRFAGRLRGEGPDEHGFPSPAGARRPVGAWRRDDDAARPHRGPGARTPTGARLTRTTRTATLPTLAGLARCVGRRTGAGQPMGWEALQQWGDDVARIEPRAGGVANDVWRVRVDGRLAVGRLGARSDADLAWETGLLRHLARAGLPVPVPVPTADGRRFAAGVGVMTYVAGGPPETAADWRRVADALRRRHRVTRGWPQRPGWRSSTDLLHAATGTKIDLGAMPPEGVARCRTAWARLAGRPTCVVHGDPTNPGNVRMTAERAALIDWDEARVDVPDLDLALPHNAAGLADAAYDVAAQASAAWDAAVCWDDAYAVTRLAAVRAV